MSTEAHRFARFLFAGGLAAFVNIISRYLLTPHIGYQPSIIVAYLIGMLVAWQLSRAFVFTPSRDGRRRELLRFSLVNAAAALQVWAISVGLAEYAFPWIGFAWHPEDVAHVIGVLAPVFTSYLGHKHFSFAAGA